MSNGGNIPHQCYNMIVGKKWMDTSEANDYFVFESEFYMSFMLSTCCFSYFFFNMHKGKLIWGLDLACFYHN